MTVKELIAALKDMPPGAQVECRLWDKDDEGNVYDTTAMIRSVHASGLHWVVLDEREPEVY